MDSIKLVNNDGDELEFDIVTEFEIEGREDTYILYTNYEKEDDGRIKLYYGILREDKIEDVTDKKDIKEIEEYIDTIEEDLKNGVYSNSEEE